VPEAWPTVPGYEILGKIGIGGMGVVYKAIQVGLNRPVALKMMRTDWALQATSTARFQADAEAAALLRHPHIVQIHAVGTVNGQPYFAMELLEGGSLAEHLKGGPWAADRAAGLVKTLAEAIHHAHNNDIFHRDLKPANVLLDRDGTPKICDFGLAKLFGRDLGTMGGQAMGTPGYISPEQTEGDLDRVGPQTDVFGLGAVLYQALTARPPYHASEWRRIREGVILPPSRIQSGVPRALERICMRALHLSLANRYASAAQLAHALERFLLWRRWRFPLVAVATVIVLGLVALLMGLISRGKPESGGLFGPTYDPGRISGS
jgi:serine/threonine-protein kinase